MWSSAAHTGLRAEQSWGDIYDGGEIIYMTLPPRGVEILILKSRAKIRSLCTLIGPESRTSAVMQANGLRSVSRSKL